MLARLFGYPLEKDRSLWYLCVEIFWAAVLAAAVTFNSVYVVRLGASNLMVGLLSSLPALLAVIVSIPSARFLAAKARPKPWILASLTLHRAGYLLVAAVPWLAGAGIPAGALATGILVIFTIPVHFFNVGFIPMLADVIPEERRAGVFSSRNMIYYTTLAVLTLAFGGWLAQGMFPLNYQVMYVIGFLATCLSLLYLIKVRVPDSTALHSAGAAQGLKERIDALREALSCEPEFVRFTVNSCLHGIGIWAATPLYTLYFVRQLGAGDDWIGLQSMVLSASTIAGYAIWRRLMGRWGELLSLRRTIVMLGVYPLLTGLLPSLTAILIVSVFNGIITAGVALSHFNTLLKVTPQDKRPQYTALYMTATNLGLFIFPLISVALADALGLGWVLAGCGLLSILGSTSFWFRPVKVPERPDSMV